MLIILKCVFIFHTACINTHVKSPSNLTSNISLLSREQCPQRAWPTHLSIRYCKMLILHWRVHALREKLGYRGRLCHNFNVQYCQKKSKVYYRVISARMKNVCAMGERDVNTFSNNSTIYLYFPSLLTCLWIINFPSLLVSSCWILKDICAWKFCALQMFAELSQK